MLWLLHKNNVLPEPHMAGDPWLALSKNPQILWWPISGWIKILIGFSFKNFQILLYVYLTWWQTWISKISFPWKIISFLANQISQATVQGKALCSLTFLFCYQALKHSETDFPFQFPSLLACFKASLQTSLQNARWTNKWSIDYSHFLHRIHLPESPHALFWQSAQVRTLLESANQKKFLVFNGQLNFHTIYHHDTFSPSVFSFIFTS